MNSSNKIKEYLCAKKSWSFPRFFYIRLEFLCSQGPSVANDYVGENSVLKTENLEASIIEIAKNEKVEQ